MTTLDWARKYLALGWSVIPVLNKIPQLQSWSEYQNRLPNEQELQMWWGKDSTNQIGIVTGKLSNLSVVDVDTKDVLSLEIRSSIGVHSPRGRHIYFKYHEGLKNHVKILENIDIRSEGGFVVAPPSPGYRWALGYCPPLSCLPEFPSHIIPPKEVVKRNPSGWIGEALSNLKEGNRDDTFTKVIGRLHHDGYTADDITLLLAPHAEACSFETNTLIEKVEHIINDYPNTRTENSPSDKVDVFMLDIRPPEWICEPIIGRGTIGFCAGLPETFKTWIVLDLAIEAARGGTWLSRFKVAKSKVLFIDQERYKGEVQRRIAKLLRQKQLTAKELDLYIQCGTTTRLDLEESFNAFRRRLSDLSPDLVIVDSFATFHTRNENDRQDIQHVLEQVKQLRQEFGCTFLFIDHENKSVLNPEEDKGMPTAFKMVGSVGKPAAAETVLTIRKLDEKNVMVYHTKSTLAQTIEPFKVGIQDTENGVLIQ